MAVRIDKLSEQEIGCIREHWPFKTMDEVDNAIGLYSGFDDISANVILAALLRVKELMEEKDEN
jgi:hypothetical protein